MSFALGIGMDLVATAVTTGCMLEGGLDAAIIAEAAKRMPVATVRFRRLWWVNGVFCGVEFSADPGTRCG